MQEEKKTKNKKIIKRNGMRNNKAITLIALVITIIVLMIISGITVATLMGDNGIIKRAGDAKETQRGAAVQDEVTLAIAENGMIDQLNSVNGGNEAKKGKTEVIADLVGKGYLHGDEATLLQTEDTITIGSITIDFSALEVESGGGGTELEKGPNGKPLVNKTNIPETSHDKIIGEDANGNQVVVPDGFKVADDSGTTVKDGIVIEDSEGNQYVWIPVSNINHDGTGKIKVNSASEEGVEITLGRYTFATSSPGDPTLAASSYQYADSYETPVNISSYYQELPTYRQSNELVDLTGTNTTAKELGTFINSVSANKGYYIARYEASYRADGKAGSKVSTSTADTLALTEAPTTRTSGDLWNFVRQGEAATACQNLYSTIKSDLMNSYAWDTAIVYIQAMGNTNYANTSNINGTLRNTGLTGEQECKIFDMAGNTMEWTTEYSSSPAGSTAVPCVYRGGNYYNYFNCTRTRGYFNATYNYYGLSFRPTLYL